MDTERAEMMALEDCSCQRCGDVLSAANAPYPGAPLCESCIEPAAREVARAMQRKVWSDLLLSVTIAILAGLVAVTLSSGLERHAGGLGVVRAGDPNIFGFYGLLAFAVAFVARSSLLFGSPLRTALAAVTPELASGWCSVEVKDPSGLQLRTLGHVGAGGVLVFVKAQETLALGVPDWASFRWTAQSRTPKLELTLKPLPNRPPAFERRRFELTFLDGGPKAEDIAAWEHGAPRLGAELAGTAEDGGAA